MTEETSAAQPAWEGYGGFWIRFLAYLVDSVILFISLILLVVLALIGIAGMQVTTLQERMAGNYYTIGRAFENTE